jgi:hypothetical protein
VTDAFDCLRMSLKDRISDIDIVTEKSLIQRQGILRIRLLYPTSASVSPCASLQASRAPNHLSLGFDLLADNVSCDQTDQSEAAFKSRCNSAQSLRNAHFNRKMQY